MSNDLENLKALEKVFENSRTQQPQGHRVRLFLC